jgi:hypothetical protein
MNVRHERAVPNSATPGEGGAHAGQQAATERRFARSLRLVRSLVRIEFVRAKDGRPDHESRSPIHDDLELVAGRGLRLNSR